MVSRQKNRGSINKYRNTEVRQNKKVMCSDVNTSKLHQRIDGLLSEVGVFKHTNGSTNTVCYSTNPICSEPIRPDEPNTYKKHKLKSDLGFLNTVMEGCRFVLSNNGIPYEPERVGTRTVVSKIERKQFKDLCKVFADEFVNLHGYISQKGLRDMIIAKTKEGTIIHNDIIRDVVVRMQANEPSMKQSGKSADFSVCTWSDSSNYTPKQKQRLSKIIECCYR